jgi:N-acetylmuramoyl-L-alanine amidase
MTNTTRKNTFRGRLARFCKKRLSSLLLFAVLAAFLNGTGSLAANIQFTDIQGHWAQADIKKAVNAGYIKGFLDATFRPDVMVTRAEFISMLNKAFSVSADGTDPNSGFLDVHDGDWFAQSIRSAIKAGYLDIYSGDLLYPNQPLSRQEAAALTANLAGLDGENEETGFADGSLIAPWAKCQVSAVAAAGIMNGDPRGYFRPEGNLTRAEAVALINRARVFAGSGKERTLLTVTSSIVNIRSGPDTDYTILAKVYKGEKLTSFLHSENNWYKVTIGAVTGWISGGYVSAASTAAAGGNMDRGGEIDRGSGMDAGADGANGGSGSDASGAAGENGANNGTGSAIGVEGTKNETGSAIRTEGTGNGTGSAIGAEGTGNGAGSAVGTTGTGGTGGVETGISSIGGLVVIDPGHGGYDDGASGPSGLKEKDVTLAIALKLSSLLRDAGYSVLLTRSEDTYVSLDNRSAAANNAVANYMTANSTAAAIFVSIHCNSSEKHTGFGTEVLTEPERLKPVYANQGNSRSLASFIQKELVAALGLTDRGIKEQDLSVCRKTNAPSVLVETAFIDNAQEEKFLTDPAFRDRAAGAVKQGIDAYFASLKRTE